MLHAGDEALGYDLTSLQSARHEDDGAESQGVWPKGSSGPDIVLIRKVAASRQSRRRVHSQKYSLHIPGVSFDRKCTKVLTFEKANVLRQMY